MGGDSLASTNGTRAILFDWDGTLRHNYPSSEHAFFDFAAQLGVPDSVEKRRRAIRWSHSYWAQSKELMEDLQTFQEDDSFWLNYAKRHLIAFECALEQANELAEKIRQQMRENYKPQDMLMSGLLETLQALKDGGILLGVVTNREKFPLEQMQTLGLDAFFDCTIAAGEVSAYKPEPEIFFHAMEKLQVTPEETIYVGDNYFADVIGAQRAGLRPVLLDPEDIFPDAGCPIICSYPELLNLL